MQPWPYRRSERHPRGPVMAVWCLAAAAILAGGWRPAAATCMPPPQQGIRLSVADGQLTSAPFRVFVNHIVTDDHQPRLRLRSAHAITPRHPGEDAPLPPLSIASGQAVTVDRPEGRVTECGTLLAFDLRPYPIEWYKPMRRVWADLTVLPPGEPEARRLILAQSQTSVNIGQPVQAWGWTVLFLAALVLPIALVSSGRPRRWPGRGPAAGAAGQAAGDPFCLLCSSDGHLSLAKVQIALWTLAVAAAVFFYGTIRVEVPSIPDSVVLLMGMSLATGGISYLAPSSASSLHRADHAGTGQAEPGQGTDAPPPGAPGPAAPPAAARGRAVPALSDLIRDFPPGGAPPELSISRAQMLLWTVLLVVLFLWKSALNGALWDVPVQFVLLTGISQAGYLAPKFAPAPPAAAAG